MCVCVCLCQERIVDEQMNSESSNQVKDEWNNSGFQEDTTLHTLV